MARVFYQLIPLRLRNSAYEGVQIVLGEAARRDDSAVAQIHHDRYAVFIFKNFLEVFLQLKIDGKRNFAAARLLHRDLLHDLI